MIMLDLADIIYETDKGIAVPAQAEELLETLRTKNLSLL